MALHPAIWLPEILEQVFLKLDLRTLLTSTQRVCRHWHNIINQTPSLQQALFFQPVNVDNQKDCTRIRNPLLEQLFWPFTVHPTPYKDGKIDEYEVTQTRIAYRNAIYSHGNASWKRMLLQQPPTSSIGFYMSYYSIPCNDPFRQAPGGKTFWTLDYPGKNLRMGDLAEPIWREIFICSDKPWVLSDEGPDTDLMFRWKFDEAAQEKMRECDIAIMTWRADRLVYPSAGSFGQVGSDLEKWLDEVLDGPPVQRMPPRRDVENYSPLEPKTIRVKCGIDFPAIERSFKISRSNLTNWWIWHLSHDELVPKPDYLDSMLENLETTPEHFLKDRSLSLARIDAVLRDCLTRYNQTQPTSQTASPLFWKYKQIIRQDAVYFCELVRLTGLVDFVLWHGPQEDVATNFIVVGERCRDSMRANPCRLMTYVAMTHQARVSKRKKNCVVYGLYTDSHYWHFCCLENNKKWSEKFLEWNRPGDQDGDQEQIISLIAKIMREATSLASTNSEILEGP